MKKKLCEIAAVILLLTLIAGNINLYASDINNGTLADVSKAETSFSKMSEIAA